LNGLDWIILAIVVVSGVISVVRGFVKEALSLASWVLAFWVALAFAAKLAILMPDALESPTVRWVAAAVCLFMVTLIVGGLANFLISTLVEKTGLSGTDRALGVAFGVMRGIAIVAILVLVIGDTAMREANWWRDSTLRPYLDPVAAWMRAHYPADMAESLLSS
jgi:membrane protein required for colicin V production